MELKKETAPKKKRSVLAKTGRLFLWIIGCILALIIIVALLIQTAPVQNFVRKKAVAYLENKLKTKVEIGRLSIKFPTALSLQNIYIEDRSKDTLLYGGEVRVNLSMFKLIKSDISINEIYLDNIVAKVKRLPPDTAFNFQFIIDAFAGSKPSTPKKEDTSAIKMNIDRIIVKNTRVVYKDAFTGNDMDIAIGDLDTKISTFDPSHMVFNIPDITLKGLHGHFYQLQPLQQSVAKTVAVASAAPETYLQFINKVIDFSDIDFAFRSDPSHINSSFVIGDVVIHPKKFDLKNGIYALDDITMDKPVMAIQMDSKKATQPAKDTLTDAAAAAMPLKFLANEIKITNGILQYNDIAAPHAAQGMDFSHLDLSSLSVDVVNIEYTADTTLASVKSATFKDRSGFTLNHFTTDFAMYPDGISIKNLLVETPNTTIKRSAVLSYPSLAAIQKNPSLMGVDIDLEDSKIAVKDIKMLAPQMSAQLASLPADAVLYVNAKMTGKVDNLTIQKLILKGLGSTNINASGTIKGLPDPKKTTADLTINKFQTTRKDLVSILPKGTLPPNITLPENLSASGFLKGGMENMNMNIAVNSSLGNAVVKGTLANITDKVKAHYDMVLNAQSLQLGTLMQNAQLGSITGNFKVKGNGLDPNTANATFSGSIPDITLNKYTYKNIKADGSIANKVFHLNASVHDPNLSTDIIASGKMEGKFPSLQMNANIDSIRALPLHLSTTTLNYHGAINADFSSTDPDNLAGNLLVTNSLLVTDSQRISIDSLKMVADNSNGMHSLNVQADFLSLSLKGQYKLTQLGDVFQQAIDPYFSMTDKKNTAKVDPYNFSINGGAVDDATLRALVPGLKEFKPITINGNFASDSGWSMNMQAPYMVYGTNIINNVNFNAGTKNGVLAFNTSVQQFKNGTSFVVYATTLNGTLQNNTINFILNIKDQKDADKYTLSAVLAQPSANNYSFSLKPENLLLNYNKWNISADNSIQYFNKDIAAHNFILSQGDEELGLNTTGTAPNSPLQIDFKNFKIATLTGFVQSDSLFVNGLLNGNAVVKNIQTQPVFTTDITVNDLSVFKDTIGNLTAKVNNNIANTYQANISLSGRGNQVNIDGNYYVKPDNSTYDFVVNVAALQMQSVQGFTKGGIKNARGYLSGKVALNGSLKQPNIDGKIGFNDIAFNVSTVNSVFRIDQSAIAIINNKGIELNSFTIKDTANNALVLDGAVNTPDFINYNFDLTLKANHFQAINSTAKDNNIFYGKMVFSTDLSITGTPTHPVVDGSLTIDDKTDFTVVLPQADPQVQSREGIVKFVDYSAPADSILKQTSYDSLKVSPLIGYDVSININVDPKAAFNVIVDEANGDFLKLKGTGELTAGIDASGKITMTGSYEIEEGSYALSFNFLKRNFIIQKGSRIVWTGDPTSAQLDVTAIYIANTAPYDLVEQTASNTNAATYKQKLPFEVHLLLKGQLMKPDITFDVVLPEDKNYNVSKDIIDNVETKLAAIREDPGEINKQVFALLLLNRFVGENPFDNGAAGSANATSIAKQSVSKLLTQQLNNLSQNLIQGVDVNFDLATTDDYTTGSRQDRTDFNVGVSKSLLSDRLTVTVGSDFQLEGPTAANSQQNSLAGNISVNYKLSKDGRYMLRAYRKNDNTGTIEGYVVETGVGFIISVDFNRLKDIFSSKEQRRKKREIKKENKQVADAPSALKEDEQSSAIPVKAN